MARLFTSGFELNSTGADVEWTAVTGTGLTTQTAIVRTGTYAAKVNPAGVACVLNYQFASANQTAPFFARIYFRLEALPAAVRVIIDFLNTANATKVAIKLTTTGTLQLFNGEDNLQIGSDSAALNLNQWYRIELKADTTTIAATVCEALIDGVSFASGNADLTAGIARLRFGAGADTTLIFYVDDVALNDSTGSFQTSFPGEGAIYPLKPNNTGDNSDWTNDYTNIDEVTPDDATTIISETTSGEIEDVNLEDIVSKISSSDIINVISIGIRFNEAAAVATDPIVVVRIKSLSGGTVEESANITFDTTTWNTNATAAPRIYPLILYDLPGSSTTPWTKRDLKNTQIGVRLTNTPSATGDAQVSTLWALVDFTPRPLTWNNFLHASADSGISVTEKIR